MNNQEARILLSSLLLKMPDRNAGASSAHRRECDFVGRIAGDMLTGMQPSKKDAEWLSDLYRIYVARSGVPVKTLAGPPLTKKPTFKRSDNSGLCEWMLTQGPSRGHKCANLALLPGGYCLLHRRIVEKRAAKALASPVISGGPFL